MPALLLTNIGQLLTLQGAPGPRRGRALGEIGLMEDAAVLCHGGRIVSVGRRRDAERDDWLKSQRKKVQEIDCRGGVVLPGFVDSHTHPAFAAARLLDFEKRIAGASYEQIAEAGGGILSSVGGVRKSSRAELARKILAALNEMAAQGTTTVEAKSGYGLSVEAELKSLEAIRDAARQWPGTVVPTLLGAHVIAKEFADRRQQYVRLICGEMVPQAARRKLALFVDVFVERGAFTLQEAGEIFAAARERGLGTRAHVCQLSAENVEPLLEFEPASLDHMDHVADAEVKLLASGKTVATLLPGANYFLGMEYPGARRLIDAGVPVALATDYNPGSSPTSNMQFVLSLACTHMRMSPAEAIAAATVNGAHALRLSQRKGSIEAGKDADLAVYAVRDYREIAYWFGSNLCGMTVVAGAIRELSGAQFV
ncbi:MAG TPA: imidazolonepropionase [Terriglobales bacterium]|nr:imidazolonepropionase [Terriglobales bacterium]